MKRHHHRPDGMVSKLEASRRYGVGYRAICQAVDDGRLRVYRTSLNPRVQLVRLEDVEKLLEPEPEGGATPTA